MDEFLLNDNGCYKFNVILIKGINFGHINTQLNFVIVRHIHILCTRQYK